MEQGQHRGSCGCLKPPRRTQEKPPSRRSTPSASAEECPHGDDGWGEFVAAADPAANLRQGRPTDWASPSSHPIMRRPDADLEEKREPRVTAKPKRSTRCSGCVLTLAAIEKRTLLERRQPRSRARSEPPHRPYLKGSMTNPRCLRKPVAGFGLLS